MPTEIPSAQDLVADARKSLEEKAFMRKKEYLTGLNSSINSVVNSFKGAVDATNAVFCKKGVKPDVIEQRRNAHTLRFHGSQRQAETDNDGCQCQQQEYCLLTLYHQIRSSLRSLSAGTSSAGFLQ